METLLGTRLPQLPVSGLRRIQDLEYFEGPLLSHFVHPHGEHYLYYWCDCNGPTNRWMVLRVSEASILRLVNGFLPLDLIIPSACRDDFVYFVDVLPEGGSTTTLVSLSSIPECYRPEPGSYLKLSRPSRMDDSLAIVVEGEWSVEALGDFPNTFRKVYSLLYHLNVLHTPTFEHFPWRGGFSSMHFFNNAGRSIPTEHRPKVSAIEYASPGFMRFSLHAETAEEVLQCIWDYQSKNADVAATFATLFAYIRDKKLNDVHFGAEEVWAEHAQFLRENAIELMDCFSKIEGTRFVSACPRPFEAAKIAMAFYRFVRELAGFEKEGLVRFPRTSFAAHHTGACLPS